MNLDRFRIGSEFVVVCGIHGAPGGEMLEGDEDFRYDYEAMFRWFHKEKQYKKCAPRNSKPFELVEKRQYQMGTVVEMSSVENPDHEGKYKLDKKSKVPVYFANFVLMDYGFGAVFGCPAHDQRDFDFAKKYNLKIKTVVRPENEKESFEVNKEAYPGPGVLINSEFLNGLKAPEKSVIETINIL